VLLAGILLVAVVGGAVYWRSSKETTPLPPDVPGEGTEPALVSEVAVLRKRILEQPRSAEGWGDLGSAFFVNNLPAPSRPCFAQAERLDPGNPRWPYFQGLTFVNSGDYQAALPYLRRAAEGGERADPGNAVPRLALAEALLALDQLDEAEGLYRQVLARRLAHPRAHLGLGRLAAAREEWETSRSHLLRCLDSPLARQKASVQLATVSHRLGDPAGARRYRQQGDRLPRDGEWEDPYQAEAAAWAVSQFSRYALLSKLESAGRIAEAASLARRLAEDYPDDFFPRLALGRDLEELGNHQGAEQNLRQALLLAPDNVKIHYELSRVLVAKGEALSREAGGKSRALDCFREALGHARRTVALQADFGHGFMVQGVVLRHLGERAAAVEALRQAWRCNPESASFHFLLGDALADEGQEAEARHHLEQALEFGTPTDRWREAALKRLDALKKKGTREGIPR
jgi:tetratricopeptide (TPR) repeat protein